MEVEASEVGTPLSGAPSLQVRHLYASATRDNRTGEIIVKVVNPVGEPVNAQIRLAGAQVTSSARAIVLAGPALTDENSFETPRKVSAVREAVSGAGASFHDTFRPYSVTVLRLAAKR